MSDDGLAPLGARASDSTVLTKFQSLSNDGTGTYIEGIPPKGPYLPCLRLGPFWQDTIDMSTVCGEGKLQVPIQSLSLPIYID